MAHILLQCGMSGKESTVLGGQASCVSSFSCHHEVLPLNSKGNSFCIRAAPLTLWEKWTKLSGWEYRVSADIGHEQIEPYDMDMNLS